MSDQARISELEAALEKTIQYLRALPPHPQTYHHANEAEAVLKKIILSRY